MDTEDLWIFAYGSLMWRPDFAYAERVGARLYGYHRALCIYSHHHRGTTERPGLVLGLDRGGSCVGLCFRIAADARAATLDAVRARELISGVYAEIAAPVRLADGRRLAALAYVARRDHDQYAGALDTAEVARLVAQGHGQYGPNVDYVRNTHAHLAEMGVRDARLAAVVERLG
ncbi:gamma-glutamylcyclotransferase [Lichenibacterium minor]|uniref:glutathione-specific gamma-glutamylcyclotransferase n=1 Tax=Lichenibacterium minor TaxID=2316528 RepID=A0A4Q2U8H3_9HYPH|nr:gamma-glutamylcyclotransferase [Lichenibacterium minor]RYC32790.1 gamma-glutamylcyclotransferase [Lichenibacterium minor]